MDCKNLVSQMSLEEKARMCSGSSFWYTFPVERLGIPKVMLTDGPCGIRKQGDAADHLGLNASVPAISYPTGACVASSFDTELLRELGETLGEECQAENIGVILGPAANIKRSPLCGRNFEYLSEDPYLTGKLSAAYIQGVQSKNVGVSLKHFACNNQETRRMTSDSQVDERSLREIYLAGFEAAVKEGKPWTVMCSYNQVNGSFAAENHRLLTEILRDEWGFDGYVVSDWGATADRVKGIEAGMDLEMPGPGESNTKRIIEAVEKGLLPISTLDTTVERILEIGYRYLENRDESAVFDYEKDHDLARRAAGESMILLKNQDILPLNREESVAFIGAYAKNPRFQGGGSSHVNSYKVTNAVDAAVGCNISFAQGYDDSKDEPDEALIQEAVSIAKAACSAVLFVGIPDRMESEGFDRKHLNIPFCQQRLIEEVCRVQKNTVVVVHCGAPIEMPWIDGVKAVLYAYLGGEAVGAATIDLLYGDINPSGKLAESFPKKLAHNPSYLFYPGEVDTVEYREGIFVGYRYYDKKEIEPLFPFGHGLSYTSFSYSDIKLSAQSISDEEELNISFKVKNTGSCFGKEVVQLYVKNPASAVIRPEKELRAFAKLALMPGEEKELSFTLSKRAFAYYDIYAADWQVDQGEYGILVGASSRDIRLNAVVELKNAKPRKKHYTRLSTLGDILSDPNAAQVLGGLMSNMPMAGMDTSSLGIGSMMDLIKDAPLKTLVSFGGGKVTEEMIDGLVSKLNEDRAE